MPTRSDLRNVAIVAHVDHGKTTLVDAMLQQQGAYSDHQEVTDRVMDSGDLEREKGITILAKNTAVKYSGPGSEEVPGKVVTINIIDTPGHADFGGEVERGLSMVDAVVLLVDASEGPLPQTRFVLRKALSAKMPVILVVNKVDRPDARIAEVVDETYDLFMDLLPEDAAGDALDFPVVYASGKAGVASLERPEDGTLPNGDNLIPLFQTIMEHVPAPEYTEGAPLQAHVTNLDSSPFLGRLALVRVEEGELKKGQQVAWMKRDGSVERVKITELLITEALDRKPGESAGPGDIVAIAGISDINIGETLADPENPVALPLIHVDEPAISMTIGTNTSPLAGREKGTKVTARLVKDRLESELIGNVSIKVLPTERPDAWEVQGRGELALAILVEQMRREGYELTVGKPQVVTREIDGKIHEPVERLTIDAPEEYLGGITQLLAVRKGRMEQMVNHGTGWVRMEFLVPARGLIGFRTEFLTDTRGTGIAHHISEGYEPWFGEISTRPSGSLVADRAGAVTSFAMTNLQERGTLFVEPGTEVYEGMIVGENSRDDDMDVNITKEKKQSNVRSSTADNFEKVIPPKKLSLEQCLEFCREDECVEVTPTNVRIRKVVLDAGERSRTARKRK
ncbi:translational GTPase TypA [Aeromicrobium sp. 636]|uniref:Large ribosomal subunit assembly factor BipA n=1 Tax=Aeromicrobium senzhongii TaxID=2663859 RepID=A0A8I0EVY8_9ACTN|nr:MULTISPECIES: translational GTPase TypA [Aeromicrobium]MBC9227235.1 translational GTPase TypA [Aeromicrobium senzhongii]MCQ3999334.1 translational GTPase TypA [Aeromicrobium sp. 636]MTB88354.1 translational GTPase TypA [Aeromicrobium senzhongii]QNL94671.1 translational GTPase TypA [Aeromicrobium senzhongii]